jgi:hypothetical protein
MTEPMINIEGTPLGRALAAHLSSETDEAIDEPDAVEEAAHDLLLAAQRQGKVRRTEQQILVSIAQLLEELLAETRHVRAALAASGSVSSVQLEQNSKGINITVKSYESSDVEAAGTAALEEFGRVFREVERRQLDGWKQTVDTLQNGGGLHDGQRS